MSNIVISGTGLFTPPHVITNDELVEAFNAYVDEYNREHSEGIETGDIDPLQHSTSEFIEKASGIKQRYAMIKEGILDTKRMMPSVPRREVDELAITAEMSVAAARQALERAGKAPGEIDLVIYGSSTSERPWPAVAVEIQKELGCNGYAFDMTVACSTATFALSTAVDAVLSGSATCALVVNPEYATPQIDYRDRDTHFIFGDVATACVVEKEETASGENVFRVIDRKLKTKFSNNIRTNVSYLVRHEADITLERFFEHDQFFNQFGRKVYKELLPMIRDFVKGQLEASEVEISKVRRMWLHQANLNMNKYVARELLGHEPSFLESPVILDEFANTASAGSIIAFHKYQDDFASGDIGILCSFGAGYSIGSFILEKV